MTKGPWLDTAHAASHVGYPDALGDDAIKRRRALKAFQMWVARKRLVASGRRGRRLMFTVADLDAAIAGAKDDDREAGQRLKAAS